MVNIVVDFSIFFAVAKTEFDGHVLFSWIAHCVLGMVWDGVGLWDGLTLFGKVIFSAEEGSWRSKGNPSYLVEAKVDR